MFVPPVLHLQKEMPVKYDKVMHVWLISAFIVLCGSVCHLNLQYDSYIYSSMIYELYRRDLLYCLFFLAMLLYSLPVWAAAVTCWPYPSGLSAPGGTSWDFPAVFHSASPNPKNIKP